MFGDISAGIPEIDGCSIYGRTKAFATQQGVATGLRYTFADRLGVPIDLSAVLTPIDPQLAGSVAVRFCEALSSWEDAEHRAEATAEEVDAATGVVRVDLPNSILQTPAVYTVSWAVRSSQGVIVLSQRSLLFVERTLFGSTDVAKGPPTLDEIRATLMDSDAGENPILDRVQFDDAQILQAILYPVRHWNEHPPLLRKFRTCDFPWTEMWLDGIAGKLHIIAANHYRRNSLAMSATGVQVADKAKEREYMNEGQRLVQTYEGWVIRKKQEINNINAYSSLPYTPSPWG